MDDLSDYEKLRNANIARNHAVMVALGLEPNDFELHNARGKKKADTAEAAEAKAARAKRKEAEISAGPSRKSTRVPGGDGASAGGGGGGGDGGGASEARRYAALRAARAEDHAVRFSL